MNSNASPGEQALRGALDLLRDGVAIYRAVRNGAGTVLDFRIEFLNPAACGHDPARREGQIGKALSEVLLLAAQDPLFQAYCQVLETGEPWQCEALDLSLTHAGKQAMRRFEARASRLDADSLSVQWHDLSPWLRRESALSVQVSRYRALVDASPIFVWEANAQGEVIFHSDSFARYTGLPMNQAGSRSWVRDAVVHPDDLPQVNLRWQTCVASGQPYEMELRLRGKDGVYRWHLNRSVALTDAQGDVTGWVGTCVNIDDLKLMDAAMRESEERFRAMADSAPLMIWVTDEAGGILFGNRAFLDFFGRKQRDIAVSGWPAVLHPDDVQAHEQAFAQALQARAPFHAQVRVCHADGDWRWVDSVGAPRFSGNGEFAGLVGCSPDITELKRASQALSEADQYKTEFLAMLAHELRNPLAPIRNAVQLMRRLGQQDPQLVQLRDVVERQTDHLARLTDDLLDVARINQGKIVLRRRQVSLAALVAHAVETTQPLIDAAGHRLTVSLPAEDLPLFVDETRVSQVLSNLLSNAVKYSNPGGTIRLSASTRDGCLHLRISDDGVGISKDMLGRVFELFTQDERSLDRARGGLGIGLTLVQRVIEMHGGTVQAFSEGPGHGSEFALRLPLDQENKDMTEQTSAGPALAAPATTGEPQRRVLVVDDNVDALETTTLLLELEGLQVASARDGAEAIAAAPNFVPHVVLLDIGLPGMNGFEVARVLRAQPGREGMLLIAVTGYGQPEDIRKSREAGFDHHVTKPVDHERLMALITSVPIS